MRFYQGGRPAVIWNPSTKRPLAEFVKGVFETEDQAIIKVLKEKGYMTQQQQEELVNMQRQSGFQQQGYAAATQNLAAGGQQITPNRQVGPATEEEAIASETEEASPKQSRALKRPRKKR